MPEPAALVFGGTDLGCAFGGGSDLPLVGAFDLPLLGPFDLAVLALAPDFGGGALLAAGLDAALVAPVALVAAFFVELDVPWAGLATPPLAAFSAAVFPAAAFATGGLAALDFTAVDFAALDFAALGLATLGLPALDLATLDFEVLGLAMDELPALPRDAAGLDDAGGDVRFAPDFLSEVVFRAAAMGACHLDSRKRERKGAGS